jgi:hypothetical protein
MSADTLQISLAVVGWIVAFLLGKELASGYSLWKARRAERTHPSNTHEGHGRP